MSRRNPRIRTILLASLFTMGLLPAVLITVTSRSIFFNHIDNELRNSLRSLSISAAREVERNLQTPKRILGSMSAFLKTTAFHEFHQIYLDTTLASRKDLEGLLILDSNGKVLHVSPFLEHRIGDDDSGKPGFSQAVNEGELVFSRPYLSQGSARLTVAAYMKMGNEIGVVLLNLDGLSDTLSLLRMNEQDQISIMDDRKLFIAHTDNHKVLEQDYERMDLGTANQPKEVSDLDGNWLTATMSISGTNWTAAYYRDLFSARKVNDTLLRQLLIALILGSLSAFAVAWLLSYWIAAPFADLMVQTGEIAAGRYDRRLKSAYLSELDRLASAFNKMAESIQKRGNALEWSLKEKDVLIQEIHHRVKNNLSVLVGLFGLAERKSPDAASSAFLEQMRRRVYAMASVHELLYSSKDYSALDMAAYLNDIANSLFGEATGHIRLEMDCEHVRLPVSHAVPLGLLANELLTNVLKHAFPDGRKGSVNVSLRTEQKFCRLIIADNGVGKQPGLEDEALASTGFELVSILATQLDGTQRMEWGKGLMVLVEFPLPTGAQAMQL